MGFTTGFISGVTLTTSIIYFSLNLHQRNRIYQSTLLSQQTRVLNNIVEPPPPAPLATAREARAGVAERVKDRWNAELEANVRKVYSMNWSDVRTDVEEGVSRVWRRLFVETRHGITEVDKQVQAQVNQVKGS